MTSCAVVTTCAQPHETAMRVSALCDCRLALTSQKLQSPAPPMPITLGAVSHSSSNAAKKRKVTSAPASTAAPNAEAPIEIVVRRGALRRYDQLKQKSGDLPVKLVWDRRLDNRRRGAKAVEGERRESDRRQPPQFTWEVADFVVVGSAARAERAAEAKRRRS